MKLGIDFGITNTDIVLCEGNAKKFYSMPSEQINDEIFYKVSKLIGIDLIDVSKIAVTGGKSSDLPNLYKNISIVKVNEVEAIGLGAKEVYGFEDKSFVAVSTGTGTACVFGKKNNFTHLGGISIGGGTLQGISNYLLGTSEINAITDLAKKGCRKKLDFSIGEVVNDIGNLYPEVTASNFAKAKLNNNHKAEDVAASITNMIGEVIGTVAYLNALLMNVDKVFFLGRVCKIEPVKNGIIDRLNLASIKGEFNKSLEYGSALGALAFLSINHENNDIK